MLTTAFIIVVGIATIFWMGAQFAINRIMHNMMNDLVEIKDMNRWLRVWT